MCSLEKLKDYGPDPYVTDVTEDAEKNENFRTAVWTGSFLQMTLMSIPRFGDIGIEMHSKTDQMIRVEQGKAIVKMGNNKYRLNFQKSVYEGEVVFVPAGTWHNIINMGDCPLKLSSVYAPPNHSRGTIHRTKEDAEKEEYL